MGWPGYDALLALEAPVAQLDRALVFGTKGCRFDSCRAHWWNGLSLGMPAFLPKHTTRRNTAPGLRAVVACVLTACVLLAVQACPVHAAEPSVPRDAPSVSEAAALLALLDLSRPGLAEVRHRFEAGDEAGALSALTLALAKRATALPKQRGYGYWLHGPANADALLEGRLTTARYGDTSVHYTADIGRPGSINFFKDAPDYPYTIRDISTMHWVNKHTEAYARTRDLKYLRAWQATWSDFADHWEAQLAAARKDPAVTGLGPDGKERIVGMGWLNGSLYVGWRLQAMREGIVGILQTASAAQQVGDVDPAAIAKLLLRLGSFEAPQARRLLKRASASAPNQARGVAMELFRIGCLFPEFKDAPLWRSEPMDVLFLTHLPDGTDREQSLNYFNNLMKEIPPLIRREVPREDWDQPLLARLQQASDSRDRVLSSLVRPDGFIPATGTSPVWNDYGKTRPLAPPSRAFTSIVFPFGGFAVQREGWNADSRYLFMKLRRPNSGHWRSQDGGLQLSAFGRNLLVSPVGDLYDSRDTEQGWRQYWESAVGQNTIVVDGMSAVERKGDFAKLDPMRWHAGTRFDFMETEITGPYKGLDFRTDGRAYSQQRMRGEVPDKLKKGPQVSDVVHRRQVHFLRELGAWVVTDRLTSKSSHEFAQGWSLGPEFRPEDVAIEASEGRGIRIATTQQGKPNLSLYQFGIPALKHELHFGVHDDHRTLGWVGIFADRERWQYTPAPLVLGTWKSQGAKVLVTLMVPHLGRDSSVTITRDATDASGSLVGFDASTADGKLLAYRSAASPAMLSALDIEAQAASLLAVKAKDGSVSGVVLDAASFRSSPAAAKDFEFSLSASAELTFTAIMVPTGFHWTGEGKSLRPQYTPASN